MQDLATVAPAFIEMAHRIVWSSVATVDSKGRPRSRILHPIWQWDGAQLLGWVATRPTGLKRGLDVFGNAGPALSVMRRLKEQFDPGRNLNAGRFAGGI